MFNSRTTAILSLYVISIIFTKLGNVLIYKTYMAKIIDMILISLYDGG